MIFPTRTVAAVFICVLMALVENPQSGDRFLNPNARVLDVLFPVAAPQRPYFLKLVLRFDDADSQLVIVVYPDHDKYGIRRCEVTTYALDDHAKTQLSESLSKLPPEASNDAVRAVATGIKVEVKHFAIEPHALDKPLSELRSIRISPVLSSRISVDDFSEYEFWYDDWQESVHYTLTGPAAKAPQDDLIRWMVRFKSDLSDLLQKSPSRNP